MNAFSKTVAYKFNTGKPGAFLHTNIKPRKILKKQHYSQQPKTKTKTKPQNKPN